MSNDTIQKDNGMSKTEHVLAFVEIANAMLAATGLESILAAITKEVSRLVDFDVSSVAILNPDKKTLVHRAFTKGTAPPRSSARGV